MKSTLDKLSTLIDQCMIKDRHRCRRQIQQLYRQLAADKPIDQPLADLIERVEQSVLQHQSRHQSVPRIEFPEALPIVEKREAIAEAIQGHQVVVIGGETGSGKTTQLPKICLSLGLGVQGMIGHTQPRRLAARTVAQRIADELHTPLGEGVGYQVRFNDQVSDSSHIKLMTDGILLAEIQRDPYLSHYDTIIIDEAHERSLNIDFLLGFLKQLLPKRPDLKLIITSATIDLNRFSEHFNDAPIIEVSGRTYDVETRYRPLEEISHDGSLAEGIAEAAEELMQADGGRGGDILVFLSGEADIRDVSHHLRDKRWPHVEILPLYARLSNAEQNKIFQIDKRRGRRIVLATNVAETSLTVPGIRYVIDSGVARISRYSYRTKVQRLPIEAISQASANQRQGRCGRVAEGICIRLYSEQDFLGRPEFTDPEIKRTNLASVILQMLSMGLGDIARFPFIDAPDKRMINDGFKLLEELGAVNLAAKHKKPALTAIGRNLSAFPIDPRLSRMLMAANEQGCLQELLIIASALSVQDPRERPADKRQAADEKHRRYWHEESDFLSYVNLWHSYEEQRQALSQNQLRKYCLRNYLSFMKMREWRDIHHQLKRVAKDLGFKLQKEADYQPASYEAVHRSLLTGLLSHMANLDMDKVYLGSRNRKLRIFPGSALFKKTPKWLMAAEIAETTQVYARVCARIDPEWVLGINDRLLKRRYSEPHWQQRTGRVMAFETQSLYGLVIKDKVKVHYGPIDPVVSREIFIRAALVEGHYKTKAIFYRHNQALVAEINDLEAKSRRRDILIEDEQLYQFYAERIPEHITTSRQFEHWYKQASVQQPDCLKLSKSQLMQQSASHISEAQFPAEIQHKDMRFALSYVFEPGKNSDGVSVTIPLALLNRVDSQAFDWLVPGMLRDKCIALVKLLPKQWRKQFVPVPDYVDKALDMISHNQLLKNLPLVEALSGALRKITGTEVPLECWQPEALDNYFKMNVRVVDANAKTLAESRDLSQLLADFKGQVSESVEQQAAPAFKKEQIRQWDFQRLPESYQFKQAGVTITSYPALVDKGETVSIELMDYAEDAEQASERGVVRLLMLRLAQQLKHCRQHLFKDNQVSLQFAAVGEKREAWLNDIFQASFARVFLPAGLPRDEQAFEACYQRGRAEIVSEIESMAKLLASILRAYTEVKKALKKANQLAWAMSVADIHEQLKLLFAEGFIVDTPWPRLQQYPRYLAAISQRIEKLSGNLNKDRQSLSILQDLSVPLIKVWQGNRQAMRAGESLLEYRWQLEEFRVSLFAQALGTLQPVSEKRLRKQLAELRTQQLVPS